MICCALDMKFWPDVQEAIAEAFHGNFDKLSMQDVEDAIEAQKMQLWGIHDGILRAVMVTEMVDYPQSRAVRVLTLTGKECEQWLDVLIKTLEEWGGENGAHQIEFTGRMGWKKVLSDYGFANPQITMSKTI
jgi:hypothetical protein